MAASVSAKVLSFSHERGLQRQPSGSLQSREGNIGADRHIQEAVVAIGQIEQPQ